MTPQKDLSHHEIARYSRHLVIPDIGMTGQVKLKQASVLVVGAGGLGSPILLYLAAAGVGRIGIVEYDVVDESNLQRQVIHGMSHLGDHKAESAHERLRDLNPLISVDVHATLLDTANVLDIIQPYDIVVDAVDNLPTRYLLNDACILLGKPLVYGSIGRFEGQLSVFDSRDPGCPCYRCLFPVPPPPELVPRARQSGVIGTLPGVIGTLQAAEVIRLITGIGTPLRGKLLLYDMLDASFMPVTVRRNPGCPSCGGEGPRALLPDYEAFCGMAGSPPPVPATSVEQVSARLRAGDITLIDVRGRHEWEIAGIDGSLRIPEGEIENRLGELEKGAEIVVFCRTSTRSRKVAARLIAAGFTHVSFMEGGLNEWAQKIDPDQPVY